MLDGQSVQQAVAVASQAATTDRAALLEAMHQLTDSIGQLVQIGGHVTTAGATVHVVEWLKGKPGFAREWNALSSRSKVIAGALAAAIPAAGIVFTFSHPEPGHYRFDFQNLTEITVAKFAWSLAQNWAVQQGWYVGLVKPRPVSGPPATGTGGAAPPVHVVEDAPALGR